jgi:hypothetical protein
MEVVRAWFEAHLAIFRLYLQAVLLGVSKERLQATTGAIFGSQHSCKIDI